MLIRRKMQLSVAIALLLALGAAYLLFSGYQRTAEIMEIQRQIGELNRGVANLEMLAHEFWINRSSRVSRQWSGQYELVLNQSEALMNEHLTSALQRVQENVGISKQTFDQLRIELEVQQGSDQTFQQRFVTEQLANQLLVTTQGLMDDIDLMETHSREELTQDFKDLGMMLSGVLVLFIAVVSTMAFIVYKNVIHPLTLLKEGTRRISRMELDYRIGQRTNDEVGAIAASFNTMAESLQKTEHEKEEAGWVRDSLLGLEETARAPEGSGTVAERLLKYITTVLDLPVAVLYLRCRDGAYRYAAGRSWDKAQCRQPEFMQGEGLPGQAAAENRIMEVDDLPERYLEVVSGQITMDVQRLLFVPLSFTSQVVAVLEIGLVRPLKEIEKAFLSQAAEKAAVILQAHLDLDDVQKMKET